ncbi:MAG TPA: L,D-transpeptidase family protein [Thermoanaerobaculia bacterium]|nr:L,D-transpeptidase family protein [Thermoanaerobaculia bacterium]
MKRSLIALVVLISVNLSAQTVDVAPATPAAKLVQTIAQSEASHHVRNFYGPNGYRLVWTRNGRPTPQALTLISLFEGASAKALDPADYAAGTWTARMTDLPTDAAAARFDVAVTATLVKYASHLRMGRVHPQSVDFDMDMEDKQVNYASLVGTVAASADVNAILSSIEPQNDDYRRLIAALATWRRIAQSNDETVPVVTKLNIGDDYAGLPQLTAKLRLYGDLPATATITGTKYEGAIVDAVKHFQSRHGLDADGIVSKKTFAQLNTPASDRVAQINRAIERARWTPAQLQAPAIVVNIPEFRLYGISESGQNDIEMRVVVGKAAGHQTPVFEGDMKHVVFRPYWNVPPSIQKTEIAAKLDSSYAARNNYEVVDDNGRVQSINEETVSKVRKGSLRVRQKPGTSNALGLVKFLFPNDNNVYLHSTPSQSLFSRTRRDFSHGCVRVEDPVALAEWVLQQKPEWNRDKIKAAINGKRDDVYVTLDRAIPVVIFYNTVVAQEDGDVLFLDDIYGHDTKLAKMLAPKTQQQGAGVLLAARK